MPNIKPSFDGKGMYSQFYDGPPPTPGPYRGVIKGMWLGKVASGDNEGADKLLVRVEINHGKFKGASLLNNLTLVKNSAWTVNQFLHALTPAGTEKQKTIMEELFWDKGVKTEDDIQGKMGYPIVNIGGKFKPIGKEVGIIVKNEPWEGNTRAVVDRFVVPVENSEEPETVEETTTEETASDDDPLGEFAAESTTETTEADSDDDDPWGDS